MSIVKSKHASNYLVISNEVLKKGLSLEAIGLLCHLLSLPHNWVIYKTQLYKRVGVGRDKLNNIFKELQESGYILSVRKQNSLGEFEYDHIVYDVPFNGEPCTENPHDNFDSTSEPHTDLPYTDIPLTAEPSTVNKQLLNKEGDNKQIINKILYPSFEDFWTAYDRKVDKPKAEKKWKLLTQQTKEKIMEYLPRYIKSTPDKEFRKYPSTFLNNQSWENEIIFEQKPQSNQIIFPR